jgi:hypothetical protein
MVARREGDTRGTCVNQDDLTCLCCIAYIWVGLIYQGIDFCVGGDGNFSALATKSPDWDPCGKGEVLDLIERSRS